MSPILCVCVWREYKGQQQESEHGAGDPWVWVPAAGAPENSQVSVWSLVKIWPARPVSKEEKWSRSQARACLCGWDNRRSWLQEGPGGPSQHLERPWGSLETCLCACFSAGGHMGEEGCRDSGPTSGWVLCLRPFTGWIHSMFKLSAGGTTFYTCMHVSY